LAAHEPGIDAVSARESGIGAVLAREPGIGAVLAFEVGTRASSRRLAGCHNHTRHMICIFFRQTRS
jgi:hypothetical protein